ncbi:hypothetical protein CPB84DRAFT_1854667 [Gymnopilus junonius]|uniref:Uncharacterized protein n=1 Tax=Gymnopilus junonius TaxID=109634 RepID=A0A9P5N8H5_GYMJU|nr:hypothetical protein CPB84DRAFT_1854667 [Gymnopilus junonius]
MDDSDEQEEEFLVFLQSILAAERQAFEDAEFEDDVIMCTAIVALGLEEARQLQAQCHFENRLYLIRPDLLPNPRLARGMQEVKREHNLPREKSECELKEFPREGHVTDFAAAYPCRLDTPWQRLFYGQNNCAFITTMGFDVKMFMEILDGGFEDLWDASPIPHRDVPSTSLKLKFSGEKDGFPPLTRC